MTKGEKWTAGPWAATLGEVPYEEFGGQLTWTVDAGEGGICVLDCPEDAREANAHLIAAAPALYEALKLYDAWLALHQDRGGKSGPKAQALDAFIRAKDAALSAALGQGE